MSKRNGRRFSALRYRMIEQRRRGEVLITAIITIFFLSTVLICQYRCFAIEQANCRQAESQMVKAIQHKLHDSKRWTTEGAKATRQGLLA